MIDNEINREKALENVKKLGTDFNWLIKVIERYYNQKEKQRQYRLLHKEEIKQYFKKYRDEHPEYRNKAKERAKKARGK